MAAKQIVVTYEGRDYTLEFNRRTVKAMESSGFKVDTDLPLTMVLDLFRGAFQMHHRKLPPDTIEKIWDAHDHTSVLFMLSFKENILYSSLYLLIP